MPRNKLTENDLQKLIHRAEELRVNANKESEELTEEELFQIAAELDIPRAYVSEALAEHRLSLKPKPPPEQAPPPPVPRPPAPRPPAPAAEAKKSSHRLFAMVTIVAIVALTIIALNQQPAMVIVEKIIRTETVTTMPPTVEPAQVTQKEEEKPPKTRKEPKRIKKTTNRKVVKKKYVEPEPKPEAPKEPVEAIKKKIPIEKPKAQPKEPVELVKTETRDLDIVEKTETEKAIVVAELPPELTEPKRPAPKISLAGNWELVAYFLSDDGEYFEMPIAKSPIDLVENWNFTGTRYRRVMDRSLSFSGRFTIEAPLTKKVPSSELGGTRFLLVGHKVRSSIPGIKRPNDYFHGELKGNRLLLFYLGATKDYKRRPSQGHLYEKK